MVQLTGKRPHRFALTLLAGVVAGAVSLSGLAGCGENPTVEANKAAAESSQKAARKAASAGDYRPTKELAARVAGKSDAEIRTLEAELKKSSPEALKKYIDQKPVETDLKEATKWLQDALGTSDRAPAPYYKALVEAQMGNNANAQAQIHLAKLADDLNALTAKATAIQDLANRIATLGKDAGLADKRKAMTSAELPKNLDAAKKALDAAKADAAAKQKAADDLAAEIKAKKGEAQKFYDEAQKQLLVADQAKGTRSIDDFDAATKVRGKGDDLTQQAANLQVKLVQAQTDAKLAAIKAAEAEETVKILATATDNDAAFSTAAEAEAKRLRDAAEELVKNAKTPEAGLNQLILAFKAQADEIDTRVGQAVKQAADARTAFSSAFRDYRAWTGDVSKMENLKPKDPLRELANDQRTPVLLQTCEASASYRVGQAQLIGYLAAQLQDTVSKAVADARSASGLTITELNPAGERTTKAQTAAAENFAAALTKAKDALRSNANEVKPIRWIPETVRAVAARGQYLANGDAKAKDEAAEAAKEALKTNPALPLQDLAAGI